MQNSTKQSILIQGGGFTNKGAEAMLRTVQRELGKRIPGLDVYASVTRADIQKAGTAGVVPTCSAEETKLKKIFKLLGMILVHPHWITKIIRDPRVFMLIRGVPNLRAVLDISGFTFSDVWKKDDIGKDKRALVRYCKKEGIPSYFLPQAWGPFSLPGLACDTRAVCQNAVLVCARDKQSETYLRELLSDVTVNLKYVPDIAFAFQGAKLQVGSQLLLQSGLHPGEKPIVGITPNWRIYQRFSGEDANNGYVLLLANVTKYFNSIGAEVVLIPHDIVTDNSRLDDRHQCKLISQAVGEQSPVVLTEEYSAETIKSVIGNLDLFIGSRFHSLVAALSCRVPTVAIGWSHKYSELLRLVDLERYAVGCDNLQMPALIELLEQAWNQRSGIKTHIEKIVPKLENQVQELFDEIAQTITHK
jgi:colanic acid/amylovoran biosynthesis protein